MLDPRDWEAFRALAHTALDDAIDTLQHVREHPVWQPVPDDVRAALREPLPREGTPLADVYRAFTELILPYGTGNTHPRFFGWVHGSGTPTGALAELLAATMNANVGGRDHGAVHVERAVIGWFHELFGFPTGASGVLTTGTSEANLFAVLVARTKALGAEVREHGVDRADGLTAYTSRATHASVRRAFDVCGLGGAALRVLETDASHRLDARTVEAAVRADRADGRRPFMLIGNAGTVDVGAIDPLADLADLAARERLWFHVDGAFGAAAMLAPSLAPRLRGIERADSIAFDFHKWLHVPYAVGAFLARDGDAHRATFATAASYLARAERGLAGGAPWFTDYTIDLSRGFRALKVWFTIKEHGAAGLGAAIEENVRQAARLGAMIEADPDFDLLMPVSLNIVCFGLRREGLTAAALDELNEEVVTRLQEGGEAVASTTTVNERRAIRVCITNQRTRESDLAVVLDALRRASTR